MMRSFRIRIALLTVALSSAVLAIFGALAWSLTYRVGLEAFDEHLRSEISRHNNESRRLDRWDRLERQIRNDPALVRERLPSAVILRERATGRIIFQSSNWPHEISPENFPDAPAPPQLLRPRQGPAGDRGWLQQRGGPPDNPATSEDFPPGPDFAGRSQLNEPFGPPPPITPGKFLTITTPKESWRIGIAGTQQGTLLLAASLQPLDRDQAQLARVLVTAAIPGLLLIAAMGGFLASRAIRPVEELTRKAAGITARDLSQRIPTTRQAVEFQRLSEVFNEMLERLKKSFHQATRFSADAAHELKTPLAILQGRIEQSLGEAADGSEHQKLCAELLEETQRLKGIVRKLLLLSLADAGQLKLHAEPLSLSQIAADAADDARVLAPNLKIETAIAENIRVAADEDLLGQVLQNLISNAIKYNGEGGAVRIELSRTGPNIRLAVTNNGAPIPSEHRPRIFERFYRADASRNRAVEGIGLGLSLSREIARAHGGDLALERSDETGTTFTLTMPAA